MCFTACVLQEVVLQGIHEDLGGGHFGVEKSVAKLKERFYWPGHYNDVQVWCATCSCCVARKTVQPHQRAPLQPVVSGYPLQMIAVDIMGPFPKTENSNCYILVAEDYLQNGLRLGQFLIRLQKLLHVSYWMKCFYVFLFQIGFIRIRADNLRER